MIDQVAVSTVGRECPTEHCQICGGDAVDDDESQMMVCSANKKHIASYWDYEWFDVGNMK